MMVLINSLCLTREECYISVLGSFMHHRNNAKNYTHTHAHTHNNLFDKQVRGGSVRHADRCRAMEIDK